MTRPRPSSVSCIRASGRPFAKSGPARRRRISTTSLPGCGRACSELARWVRSLSALFGVLTIPVAFGAARAAVSERAGLIAAGLVAVDPFLVYYSQEARSYALYALLATCSMWAFAVALRSSSTRALEILGAGRRDRRSRGQQLLPRRATARRLAGARAARHGNHSRHAAAGGSASVRHPLRPHTPGRPETPPRPAPGDPWIAAGRGCPHATQMTVGVVGTSRTRQGSVLESIGNERSAGVLPA